MGGGHHIKSWVVPQIAVDEAVVPPPQVNLEGDVNQLPHQVHRPQLRTTTELQLVAPSLRTLSLLCQGVCVYNYLILYTLWENFPAQGILLLRAVGLTDSRGWLSSGTP